MVLLHVKGDAQQVTDSSKSLIATYAAPGAGVGSPAISVLAGGDAAVNVQVNA